MYCSATIVLCSEVMKFDIDISDVRTGADIQHSLNSDEPLTDPLDELYSS
jgi:hypothetical protein